MRCAGIGRAEQMDVGLEQAEHAVGLAAGEEAHAHLALRIGGPFHAQRHRIALADDRRHPRVPAIVEEVQRLHRDERLACVGLFGILGAEEVGAQHDEVQQINSPALTIAR